MIKFLTLTAITVLLAVIGLIYFDDSFIPEFPYKYSALKEKSTQIKNVEMEIQITKRRVEEWKERIEIFKKENENTTPVNPEYTDVIVKKMPKGLDYASVLLFLEEQALLNDVIVSDINLNRDIDKNEVVTEETTEQTQEQTTEPTAEPSTEPSTEPPTEVPTEPAHVNQLAEYGVEQKTIEFVVMGDYLKIEEFIKSVSEDMGVYNFIETITLSRGNSEVINWDDFKAETSNVIPNEETTEPTSEIEDGKTQEKKDSATVNKNIVVTIKMVINYKTEGGN